MTDRDYTLELPVLLRERPTLERSAEGLLSLLSAAHHGDLTELKTRLTHDRVEWAGLVDWLEDWPDPPADMASMRAWLRDTEDLARAEVGLARLGDVGQADRARRAASSSLERARAAVDARADHALYAGEAEKRRAIPPWSWIRTDSLVRLLDEEATGAVAEEIARLATRAGLAAADEALFAREVAGRPPLLHAYRVLVHSLTETVHVTTWNPAWSLDVARDVAELDDAAELLRVHLPHAAGALSVRQHADGTWWRYPSGTETLVPHDARLHRWHDALLGALETRIHVHTPTPAEDAWHGVGSLVDVACGKGKTRGLEVALALAAALREGAMSDAIAAAHDAFERGEDLVPEDEHLVSHAFVARLTMSDAAAQLDAQGIDVAPLQAALARADERHRAHRSASFFVPDDVHDELVRALPADPAEWWGHRATVDAVVPAGAIESALGVASSRAKVVRLVPTRAKGERIAETPAAYGPPSNVIAFPGARVAAAEEVTRLAAASAPSLRPDLPREPCPWLRTSPEPEAPTPGRVPLILYDEEHDRGVLAELRVFVSDLARESLTWAGAPMLERVARETIRDAYRAAASCTANRIAPRAFAAHRLELVIDPSVGEGTRFSVEGSSVGLSAALAFASAWLDRPIAPTVVPLGTVARWGRVGAVGAVREKAGAVPASVTFVVGKDNAGELSGASVEPVERLAEALELARLALSALSIVPASEKVRLKALRDLIDIVEDGDLQSLGEQARWSDAGDGIRDLVDTFGDESPHQVELSRARVMAALAYSHAGMLKDVNDMLRSVDRNACTSLEARTLFDIVELGGLIDAQKLESGEAREAIERLEADVRELERGGQRRMLGRALGTLGRARMHARDLDEALPLLAAAVDAHAAHEPHELARSRQYHAMALRMSGAPEAALGELVQAQRDLETLTREYSPEYEASCRVFLEYELARTLVALERYDDAVAPASSALADCAWQAWPQLGLLRVRAWAHRMLGQDALAAADVERMREVGPGLGPHHAALVARLIDEAEGYPVDDGEVY